MPIVGFTQGVTKAIGMTQSLQDQQSKIADLKLEYYTMGQWQSMGRSQRKQLGCRGNSNRPSVDCSSISGQPYNHVETLRLIFRYLDFKHIGPLKTLEVWVMSFAS